MTKRMVWGSACLLGLCVFTCVSTLGSARAGDLFELQVYENDVNRPWQPGLEIHTNYTLSGRRAAAYDGEQAPHHVARLTLEPALGLTSFLEVGAYLLNMVNADGHYDFAGWKLRTKWVVPERYTGKFLLGLNAEVGKVSRAVEEAGWANEFRPIVGFSDGHWLAVVNPIIGYALSGPDKYRPDFEPAAKVAWNTQRGFMIGAEYYAGLGYLSDPAPVAAQEHLVFLTFDLAEAVDRASAGEPWELNVGLGRALTDATPQQWIVKAIFGRAF